MKRKLYLWILRRRWLPIRVQLWALNREMSCAVFAALTSDKKITYTEGPRATIQAGRIVVTGTIEWSEVEA